MIIILSTNSFSFVCSTRLIHRPLRIFIYREVGGWVGWLVDWGGGEERRRNQDFVQSTMYLPLYTLSGSLNLWFLFHVRKYAPKPADRQDTFVTNTI